MEFYRSKKLKILFYGKLDGIKMFDKLNDRQKEAVMHIDGPCLVIAGAG